MVNRAGAKIKLTNLEELAREQRKFNGDLPPIKITADQIAALKNGESIKIYGLPLQSNDFRSLDNLEQVTDSTKLMGVLTESKLRQWANKEF